MERLNEGVAMVTCGANGTGSSWWPRLVSESAAVPVIDHVGKAIDLGEISPLRITAPERRVSITASFIGNDLDRVYEIITATGNHIAIEIDLKRGTDLGIERADAYEAAHV